jgi:hypothetical protein
MIIMAEGLRRSRNLKALEAASVGMGKKGCAALAAAVEYLITGEDSTTTAPGDKKKAKTLTQTGPGQSFGTGLSQFAQQNSTVTCNLTVLDIQGNDIKDPGMIALTEALKQNRSITK